MRKKPLRGKMKPIFEEEDTKPTTMLKKSTRFRFYSVPEASWGRMMKGMKEDVK